VEEKNIFIGTRSLMIEQQLEISGDMEETMEKLEKDGKTAMLIGTKEQVAGVIAVADTVKETSQEAIDRMRNHGLDDILVTGENERTAKGNGKAVHTHEDIAEVVKDQKSEQSEKPQAEGKIVAMVGDGINDAPALATADIGMAVGPGTDIAIEAADITLMRGDLNSVADAMMMSKKTMKNIKEHLFFAFIYNTIGIPIAAIGLLAPWVAGAAMAFSSVSVVTNALRLQRVSFRKSTKAN